VPLHQNPAGAVAVVRASSVVLAVIKPVPAPSESSLDDGGRNNVGSVGRARGSRGGPTSTSTCPSARPAVAGTPTSQPPQQVMVGLCYRLGLRAGQACGCDRARLVALEGLLSQCRPCASLSKEEENSCLRSGNDAPCGGACRGGPDVAAPREGAHLAQHHRSPRRGLAVEIRSLPMKGARR
jgi:hypothetical protein